MPMSKLMTPVVWVAIIATLAGIVIMGERTRADVHASIRAVTHTLDVQRAFNVVLKTLLDAETGQRGFLLTGRREYLEPWRRADETMAQALDALSATTARDEHQISKVRVLSPTVAAKVDELRHTVRLAEDGNVEGAVTIVKTDRGRQLMDTSRTLLDAAFVDEQRILRDRLGALDRAISRRAMLTYAMAALLVAVVAKAIWLHRKLKRLQPLVTLCAWSKTVRDGDEWVSFEVYLERRFGVRVTHGLSPKELALMFPDHPPQ
jgi:CHASE3 domain sensor protein